MIGDAVPTADVLEMKSNIIRRPRVEHAEQILAKFIAAGAGKSIATPDHTDAVQAGVLAANHRRQPFPQLNVIAKSTFNQRQLVNRQRFLEVSTQHLVTRPIHGVDSLVAEVALTSAPFASSLSAAGSSVGLAGHGGITFPSAPFDLPGVVPRNDAT